jgi:hypothetical protein
VENNACFSPAALRAARRRQPFPGAFTVQIEPVQGAADGIGGIVVSFAFVPAEDIEPTIARHRAKAGYRFGQGREGAIEQALAWRLGFEICDQDTGETDRERMHE